MSLKIWLPLNGDLTNNGVDNSTITNTSATFDNNGKIGKCAYFNGAAKIQGTESYTGWTEYSIAFWFKVASAPSTWSTLVTLGKSNGWANEYFTTTTNGSKVYTSVANGSNYKNMSASYTAGQWNHVAATYKDRTLKLYVNGAMLNSGSASFDPTLTSSNLFSIGRYSNNAEPFTGYINDVRLYDHCLSDAEIHELSMALVCHYKLDRIGQEGNNLVTGLTAGGRTTVTNNNTVTTAGTNSDTYFTINLSENIVVGQRYTLSCNASNVASGYKWRFPLGAQANTSLPFFIDNGYNEYTFVANDISWGNNRIFMDDSNTSNNVRLSQAVFTDFRLYKADTIIDASGYEYNLITNGTIAESSDTARYTDSLVFDGSTSYLNNVGMKLPLTGDPTFTYSAWIKWNGSSWPSNYPCVMRYGTLDSYKMAAMCIYAGRLDLDFWNYRYIQDTASMTVGTWHHVVATKTVGAISTTCKLYVDGVEVAGTGNSASSPTVDDTSSQFVIGVLNSSVAARWFNGNISDVRVYATALSADDVKKLYALGMKVDNAGAMHGFEYDEDSKISVGRNGITEVSNLFEQSGLEYLRYDPNVYVEPDGSCWLRVFHHANPASARFSSTDDFVNSVYLDANRWFNVAMCSHVDKWELIVAQQPTTDGAISKFRFIQTANPMTASFSAVAAANITKITSSGDATYASSSSSYGGIMRSTATQTYLCANNGTSGNWWGAIGCNTVHNGGSPGYNATTITTGYIDLYLRIDNVDFSTPTIAKFLYNKGALASKFLEI